MASEWYYLRNGREQGPVSTAELKQLAAAGQITPGDLIWREGMAAWAPAGQAQGLFPTLQSPSPAVPAPHPELPTAQPVAAASGFFDQFDAPPPVSANPYQSPQSSASDYRPGIVKPRGRYASPRTLGIVVAIAFGIAVFAMLLNIVASYLGIPLLEAMHRGQQVPKGEAAAKGILMMFAGGLYLLSLLASAIVFIMWFYRVHSNLAALGNGKPQWASGWTIGAWFIPFGSLLIPFLVMAEVWKGSDPQSLRARRPGGTSPLVIVWWAGFVVMNLAGIFGNAVSSVGPQAKADINSLWVSIVVMTIGIPAAIAAVVMVFAINGNQQRRYQRIQREAAGQPAGAATSYSYAGTPFAGSGVGGCARQGAPRAAPAPDDDPNSWLNQLR